MHSVPLSCFVAGALGLCSQVLAQSVAGSATAVTQLKASALSVVNTLPVGSVLTGGVTLSAYDVQPDPFGGVISGSTSSLFGVTVSGDTVTYEIVESANATGAFGYAQAGSHQTLLTLSSPVPIEGVLRVAYTSSLFGFASVVAAVDAGNDGTDDWTATTVGGWQMPLTLAGSFEVRTTTSVISAYHTLTITFEPIRTIHDNGPLVTHPGGAAGGADGSANQNTAPLALSTLGFNINGAAANQFAIADEFVIADPAGWTIDSVEAYAYQTGSTTTSTITGMVIDIYDGNPSLGGLPVSGSPTGVNLLTAGQLRNSWSGIYRASIGTIATDTARPVMAVQGALPTPLTLAPGSYWIAISLTGSLASGPWMPPIAVLGKGRTGNALQRSNGVWAPLTSGTSTLYPQGMAFKLFGTRADAVGDIEQTTAGCTGAQLRVNGAPVLGGFLRADLSNPTPGTFPWIGLDLNAPPVPVPFCGCEVGHFHTLIVFGSAYEIDVPANAALFGATLYVQGIEFGVSGVCPDLPIVLTETFRATFR